VNVGAPQAAEADFHAPRVTRTGHGPISRTKRVLTLRPHHPSGESYWLREKLKASLLKPKVGADATTTS
jgi:hypothetical protein